MTIAVTGASGYVGTTLVARLVAAGVTVRALVRDPRAALPAGVERAIVAMRTEVVGTEGNWSLNFFDVERYDQARRGRPWS